MGVGADKAQTTWDSGTTITMRRHTHPEQKFFAELFYKKATACLPSLSPF
jgi:hypothetical protein